MKKLIRLLLKNHQNISVINSYLSLDLIVNINEKSSKLSSLLPNNKIPRVHG